ncbi:acyl-CoA dehydrogenase family protein [Micromonospora craniellae]|uniref:Acyl-CoA dehydrogenase n=1 Tax=Micromonospora craniellae TaxID=2294034 RepID=A0A372G370_9ACTN|nr:acyl-CoA dehydrogenase family protein [Micromonospora craniellae]QOC92134.1 acyl-CoA/acyl-ACP dehydrogenase [Micromonospora craniellae]RFS47408.1 acyl-CoA dehydrogenase [Micromonospora craniellae]
MTAAKEVAAELGTALRDFLGGYATPVVPVEDGERVWSRLCGELGLAGLLVPESRGGLGFGAAELVAVAAELGRAVVGGPFVPGAVAAATALSAVGTPRSDELLEGIAAGSPLPTLVHVPFASGRRVAASTAADGALTLTGTVGPVLAVPPPCPVLVPADVAGSPVLALVAPDAPGATLTPLPSLDLSRPAWRAGFHETPATVLADGVTAAEAIRRAEIATCIALGAECVGVAGHALELTVDHAKTRHQFGRPIGAFQALAHTLADLTVTVEVARSAAAYVTRCGGDERSTHTLAVKASEAAVTVTTEAIQLHGGIGFTWEYPAHVLLRRAHSAAVLAGTPDQHRRALFALVDER